MSVPEDLDKGDLVVQIDDLDLEQQIAQWRTFAADRQAVHDADVDELEDHLRSQVDDLRRSGLSGDEAFLVAVKRMGSLDAVSREFAVENSDRLWKQLVLPGTGTASTRAATAGGGMNRELLVMFAMAFAAALATIVVAQNSTDYMAFRLGSFTVLPFVAGYLAWKRNLDTRLISIGLTVFGIAAAAILFYPFDDTSSLDGNESHTGVLAALHLPLLLWFVVGLAYAGARWQDSNRRMDFVRFTGEAFIYYVLLALGGGVLLAMSFGVFESIGVHIDDLVENWVLPGGIAGAAVVAAWLVEAKQGVIEAMAPVLTRIFSPLFAIVFAAFLVTMLVTGRGFDLDRDVLILFDLLLVVVLGLVLYSISARDSNRAPGWFDYLQLMLIVTALAIDVMGLGAILGRISEFGFSPNKTAALGENILLAGNLAAIGWLYAQFVSGRRRFVTIERWQTSYLLAYPLWAAVVIFVFPFLFDFA